MKLVRAEPQAMEAAKDIRFLLSRGYTRKNSLSIVSSRYSVTESEKRIIFRGVYDGATAEEHRRKCLPADSLTGKELGVDWFNVLITVDSGLSGEVVVDSDDGFLRDIRGLHGEHPTGERLERATDIIIHGIAELRPSQVLFLLDANVSKSGEMASFLRETVDEIGIPVEVRTAKTPDRQVASREVSISSDSVIIRNSGSSFDLPRHVLSSLGDVVAYVLR